MYPEVFSKCFQGGALSVNLGAWAPERTATIYASHLKLYMPAAALSPYLLLEEVLITEPIHATVCLEE